MISIIIPAYNEEKYIGKTLASIGEQVFSEYEAIVVANGCTDDTVLIAKKHPCRVVRTNEANVSRARNTGASLAKGDLLVFLDADTQLTPKALFEIDRQFSKKDAVGTMLARPNSARLRYKIVLFFKDLLHITRVRRGSSGIIIAPRTLFNKVGGFDPSLAINEDDGLIRKLLFFGGYKVIRRTHVTTSMRRYEKWGMLRLAWFWIVNKHITRRNAQYEAVR